MYFIKKINHHKLISIQLFVIFFLLTVSCNPENEKSSFDQNILDDAYTEAVSISGLQSLLVNYKDNLVGEEYFNGGQRETTFQVRSVTKSIVSILIGIAIEKGLIAGTDLSIIEELSTYQNENNQNQGLDLITIEHLLTMSSGFEWNEMNGNAYSQWIYSQDKINYVLEKQIIYVPGDVFNYNSGTSHLLSVILAQASGQSTLEFANQYLFDPLGINNVSWREIGGYNNGGSDIQIKARDLIKIGELYLNNGMYDGTQIVSSNWVNESITSKIMTGRSFYGSEYGYLWWLENFSGIECFYAMGYGGQFLFVLPELELIIVANSNPGTSGQAADQQWLGVYDFITDQVLPAFL
jgi:CubicO group peptidase (beta-lactamase class C family)